MQLAQALFALVAVSLLVVGATLAEREAGSDELARDGLASPARPRLSLTSAAGSGTSAATSSRWSDELYRIFGIDPDPGRRRLTRRTSTLRPSDDRAFVDPIGRLRALATAAVRLRAPHCPAGRRANGSPPGTGDLEETSRSTMLGTSQDVTEQRQAERLREDILSAVSHELRTPLTSVLGFALTLEQRAARALELGTLDRSCRELARPRAGLGPPARRPARRRALARAAPSILRARSRSDLLELVRAGGRRLSTRWTAREHQRCGPRRPRSIAAKVERIVEHLIVNAAKHTPAAELDPTSASRRGRPTISCSSSRTMARASRTSSSTACSRPSTAADIRSATPGARASAFRSSLALRTLTAAGWVEDRPGRRFLPRPLPGLRLLIRL